MSPREDVRPLHLEEVTVRFGGITALDSVSTVVEPGTVHAQIGRASCRERVCAVV